MKKALLLASLLALMMVVGVTQATAQENITVTVTIPSVISVSLDTDAWSIGSVAVSATSTSSSIKATNNGNVAETFTIQSGGSTSSSGTWTCGETAASETFEMKATGGDLSSTSIHTSQTLETPVAIGDEVDFTLSFKAPTATTSIGVEHSITVTVTASATT